VKQVPSFTAEQEERYDYLEDPVLKEREGCSSRIADEGLNVRIPVRWDRGLPDGDGVDVTFTDKVDTCLDVSSSEAVASVEADAKLSSAVVSKSVLHDVFEIIKVESISLHGDETVNISLGEQLILPEIAPVSNVGSEKETLSVKSLGKLVQEVGVLDSIVVSGLFTALRLEIDVKAGDPVLVIASNLNGLLDEAICVVPKLVQLFNVCCGDHRHDLDTSFNQLRANTRVAAVLDSRVPAKIISLNADIIVHRGTKPQDLGKILLHILTAPLKAHPGDGIVLIGLS